LCKEACTKILMNMHTALLCLKGLCARKHAGRVWGFKILMIMHTALFCLKRHPIQYCFVCLV